MKRHIILIVALLVAVATPTLAQNQADSLRHRARMAELSIQRKTLQQRIASEDKLRNSQLPDVSPEQMELINLRQDSVCLELRSQLAEVELELAELNHTPLPVGVSGSSTPVQATPTMQQILQSLKPTRPQKKEEATENK